MGVQHLVLDTAVVWAADEAKTGIGGRLRVVGRLALARIIIRHRRTGIIMGRMRMREGMEVGVGMGMGRRLVR